MGFFFFNCLQVKRRFAAFSLFFVSIGSSWRRGIGCLCTGIALVLFFGEYAGSEEFSVAVPMAARSLLLDGVALEDGRLIVVGERGHILWSEDQGAHWVQARVPTRATLTAVSFHDAKTGWAVGHDAVILMTHDGGKTWERVYHAPEEEKPLLDFWSLTGRNVVAVGAYGFFLVSNDWGKTWRQRPISEDDWHLNQIALAGNGNFFIAAEGGMIYRSEDDANTWQEMPSPYEGSFFGVLPLKGNTLLLFGLRGNLFRSEDAGNTWQKIETGTEAMLNAGLRLSDGRIVIVGLAGTVLVSKDDGRHFKHVDQADRRGISSVVPIGHEHLLLIGDGGVKKISIDFDRKEP